MGMAFLWWPLGIMAYMTAGYGVVWRIEKIFSDAGKEKHISPVEKFIMAMIWPFVVIWWHATDLIKK
jgi:hypothetical protein